MRYLILIIGCYGGNPYAIDNYENVSHYPIHYTQHTPKGIGVDANGLLDLADIDRRTDEVENCLLAQFPDGKLSASIMEASSCILERFNPHIQREYIGVKLAPDWFRACYDENWQYVGVGNGEEIFPADVDPALCEAKGFVVNAECSCGVRAIIQDNSTIVSAPNLHLYKAELIRLTTGCNSIWKTPQLAGCWTDN